MKAKKVARKRPREGKLEVTAATSCPMCLVRDTLPSLPEDGSVSPVETHPTGPANVSRATTVIVCGSFPPLKRDMNFFYPNVQNDMWPILGSVFYSDPAHFFRHAPKPKGPGTRKVFDVHKVSQFTREHPEVGFCDVAKRVVRKKNDASDEGLNIVEENDFAHDVLPTASECKAIVTTGTLAFRKLVAQRDGVTERPRRMRKMALPSIGECTHWPLTTVGADGAPVTRTIDVYRAPSTSRAYPRPFAEKEAVYRSILGRFCSL